MSLLKEGDEINFQKASFTLDGCVKIYTSRIDSVATETGKLLSGLADSAKNQGKDSSEEGGNDAEDDSEGEREEGERQKKTSKRKPRGESTLAPSYEKLQAKKMDFEVAIDPLFRKMCADFDEGGANGLLLNSLVIDKTGRVVFDGEADDDDNDDDDEEQDENNHYREPVIDIDALRDKYFPNLAILDQMDVCPSMDAIKNALDPELHSSSGLKDIGSEFNSTSNNIEEDIGMAQDMFGDFGAGDNDDDDMMDYGGGVDLDGFADDDDGLTFGEANTTNNNSDSHQYNVTTNFVLNGNIPQENDIMSYFDETLKKNWAGPEHWKVQKLKANFMVSSDTVSEPKKRATKEKDTFFINFVDGDHEVDESVIFTEGGSSINIPKTQWKSKNRNLLPDDRHFTSRNLIKLFLKPKGNIMNLRVFSNKPSNNNYNKANNPIAQEMDANPDEHFWAEQYNNNNINNENDGGIDSFGGGPAIDDGMPDYDDDYDNVGTEPLETTGLGDLQDELILASRRAKPEYVNYAKTATKVNVKLLKDNIWNIMDMNKPNENDNTKLGNADNAPEEGQRVFSDLVRGLETVYLPQQMSEISTSYCFICVLHLANEQGLVLENNNDHSELYIRKDPNAPVPGTELLA